MDDTVSLEGACMCAAELLYVGAEARERGTEGPLLLFSFRSSAAFPLSAIDI